MPASATQEPTRARPQLAFSLSALAFIFVPWLAAIEPAPLDPPSEATVLELYNSGQYESAVQYVELGQEFDPWNASWEQLKARALIATGQYDAAYTSLQAFVADRSYELRARLLLRQVAQLKGLADEAELQQEALGYLVNERAGRYSYNPDSIAAVGDIALLFGVEPKLVLENFYRRALSYGSQPLSAFIGIGELALSKDDFKLASKTYQEGLEIFPGNVELLYGLARSFREDDRSKMIGYLDTALSINPRHGPSRILLAEHAIAAEAYEEAEEQLALALETNPRDYAALALRAALAYLQNRTDEAEALRAAALDPWKTNPEVDYIIGAQLSRKYRFAEGAERQRRSLAFDENFGPAKLQLAQDLLRLARNEDAWPLAQEVHREDPYNVSAYNLVTLQDRLGSFTRLESENFILQLHEEEAAVYGPRALRILEAAHRSLAERFQVELPQKTVVEVYAEPADFETRTFGVPGNPGYLGVCFGPVFTINSPATRSANWEAVLYHEYCHTITLWLSQNRMPRWLSEGLSVYEETVENPSWGQRMTAGYRDRILEGRMQSITSMSAAFLRAASSEDVQFAYYQSYLAVDYLAQKYGLTAIRSLLVSLGQGEPLHLSFAQHLAPLEELDEGFTTFARDRAATLAPGYRFSTDTTPLGDLLDNLANKKPYPELLAEAEAALAADQAERAVELLQPLVEEVGYLPGPENAHRLLATAYRELGDTQSEKAVLEQIYAAESNRLEPIVRLHDLAEAAGSAGDTFKWANAWIAINPMAATPWRSLLGASTQLQENGLAIESAKALLALGAPDSASLNYQLAKLLQETSPETAQRHLMLALQEAPRFQNAYPLYDALKQEIAAKRVKEQLQGLDLNYDFAE